MIELLYLLLFYIDDRFTLPSIIFKGKDCINKFITWVLDKQKWTQQITKKYFNKRLIMTNEDIEIYNSSHICWICKQELNTDKVKDHCTLLVNLEELRIINVI